MIHPSPPSAPPGRRVAFTIAALLLPVAFFALLEGGLRLAGYGDSYPLFVEWQGDYGRGQLYQNREVARRYFARQRDVPVSLVDPFPEAKGAQTLRIFVQGGSSAAGFPYYHGAAFSRMLQQRLQASFPERRVEVVNTAMAAVNSYTLLDLADEILAQRPDAVVVYAGHNEYYGALGVGSAETLGAFPALVRAYLRLMNLRTAQLLRSGLSGAAGMLAGGGEGRPSGTLMARMVGEQSIPYASPLYELGLRQWESNLGRLLETYRDAGVPVFIGTLASNERDHAPFLGGSETAGAAYDAAYREGVEALRARRFEAAVDAFSRAVAMDTTAADAFYGRARALEARGDAAAARADYTAAKDRDRLRFRAPEAANAVIRAQAARHGATVVEVKAAMEAASPTGIVGRTLMTEHLHPNVDGYFVIADAFYDALLEAGLGGAPGRRVPRGEARAELLLTSVDSLVGTYRLRQLMAAWPFQPPGVVDDSALRIQPDTPEAELALRLWRDQTTWIEAMQALMQQQTNAGEHEAALRTARALLQVYPFVPPFHLAAAGMLVRLERLDEAEAHYREALALEETGEARAMLGALALQAGRRGEAVEHLRRAVALDASNLRARYNLAGAYALEGDHAAARREAEAVLARQPGHGPARALLNSLPALP